jgi:VanZ family protein
MLIVRKVRPSWIDWLMLALWMAIIFYFSSQLHPDVPGVEYTATRKGLHMLEFIVLFVLWRNALYGVSPSPIRVLRAALTGTAVYAVSDELHQHFVGRDGNVIDVCIDLILPALTWLTLEARQRIVRLPLRSTGR